MVDELTDQEKVNIDKLAKKLDECGLFSNWVERSRINYDISQLEKEARVNKPEWASKSAPLVNFLPPEKAAELRRLKNDLVRVRESIKISEGCADQDKELGSLILGSGLFRIAKVKEVHVVEAPLPFRKRRPGEPVASKDIDEMMAEEGLGPLFE